MTGIYYIIVH